MLNEIEEEYNYIRPHESLGMKVPASRYKPSTRSFNPTPKATEYPSGSIVLRVDQLGRFSYRNLRLFASESLAGENIRLVEVNSSAIVYYRKTALREIDLDTGESSQKFLSES